MIRKTSVLHILWSGGIGGTEEYITSLVRQSDLFKYEIHLCFLSQKGVIYEEAKKIADVNVVHIGMKNGFDIVNILKLIKYLRQGKFDIIHSHSPNILTNIVIFLFKRSRKIFTEHVSPGAKDLFEKRKSFYKLFSNRYQKVTAISEFVKKNLVENMHIDPKKIVVVHNGIRMDKYHNMSLPPQDMIQLKKKNGYIIGFVGRMINFKRPHLFVEIASELIKKDDKYHFIMVGDGPELERCRKMIIQYNISQNFELLGYRRDIPNLLTMFDALLFTSLDEGFGIVLIEAMAMGVPVFAINQGAVSEIINHKENGILLDSINPEEIAQQILKTVENKAVMEKIKKQCVEDVHSKFTIEKCVNKIENIYMEMLGNA